MTYSLKRLLPLVHEDGEVLPYERPRTRGECVDGPRPCPFVGCKFNLFLDVNHAGSITTRYQEPSEMQPENCVLDVADRGGITLEEVGEKMGVTRERIRQIEFHARVALKASIELDRSSP